MTAVPSHPTSPRLTFRSWTLDDLPLAHQLWLDPRVTEKISASPLTPDQVAQRLRDELDRERVHGFQMWPTFLRDSGAFAGVCGLKPRDPAARVHELGYALVPSCWGQGLAEEAARATIRHAFDVLGATALFAGHHPTNDASRRILQKLGFRHTHDEPYPPTGMNHPSYLLVRG